MNMIQFPKTLHQLHRWRQDRELYLFDMEKGLVLSIDQLTWDILALCEDHSTEEVFRELTPKYTRAEIQENLRKLSRLEQLGFLFSDSCLTAEKFSQAEQLSIFVPEGVLLGQVRWDLWTTWHHFCLLRALTRIMSVSMAFPERMRCEMETAGRGLEDIKKVYFYPSPDWPVTWSVPKECHVIFNLSTQSVMGLKHLCSVKLPVVSHVSSSEFLGISVPKLLLAYLSALREYDAIVVDSPWLKEFLTLPKQQERIFYIPPGIDFDQIHPMEKLLAKKALADAQGNERLLQRPLIGLISGWSPQKAAKVGSELADANPDLEFILIDSHLADGFVNQPKNLHTFGVRGFQEKETLSVFLSAFDLCIAEACPGTPASLLVEAMAYGSAILGIGEVESELKNPWRDGIVWVETTTQSSEALIEILSRKARELLQNQDELQNQHQRAREVALSFSWERVAQQYVELFQMLIEKRNQSVKSHQSALRHLFVQKPHHGKPGWNWTAIQLPHLFESDPWEALMESLKRCGCTEQEIGAVINVDGGWAAI